MRRGIYLPAREEGAGVPKLREHRAHRWNAVSSLPSPVSISDRIVVTYRDG